MGWNRWMSAVLVAASVAISGTNSSADEKHVGEDLSLRNFAGKGLDDSTFEDCILKNASFDKASLIKATFKGCDLTECILSNADCTEADFRGCSLSFTRMYATNFEKADLSGCDLSNVSLSYTKFRNADLRNLKGIRGATSVDFFGADLRGANLVGLQQSGSPAIFRNAKYDKKTKWPKGFDVEESGAKLVETEEAPGVVDTAKQLSKEFAKLDANEDGRLSGSEMKGLEAYDTDKNGRITFEEFVEGKTKKE